MSKLQSAIAAVTLVYSSVLCTSNTKECPRGKLIREKRLKPRELVKHAKAWENGGSWRHQWRIGRPAHGHFLFFYEFQWLLMLFSLGSIFCDFFLAKKCPGKIQFFCLWVKPRRVFYFPVACFCGSLRKIKIVRRVLRYVVGEVTAGPDQKRPWKSNASILFKFSRTFNANRGSKRHQRCIARPVLE